MNQINTLINELFSKDSNAAYRTLQALQAESEKKNTVYSFFDTFTDMMNDPNSYIRTRGLLLIATNAKWDTENKIDEIIDEYLKHILDVKPITARQCIKALPLIARYKPDLSDVICIALRKANPYRYPDSMSPLIQKDITAALNEIQYKKGMK